MNDEAATLHLVEAHDFGPWVESAVAVYTAAMGAPRSQISGRRSITERHLGYPDFVAHLAVRGKTLVGFCYGFHGQPGQWWHDAVRRGFGEQGRHTEADRWLADCFEVAELQVLPNHQKRGIGRALITGLCARRREETVVLSTHDVASPARGLYRSLGFADLLTGFHFPAGGEEFAVMGAPLPLRS